MRVRQEQEGKSTTSSMQLVDGQPAKMDSGQRGKHETTAGAFLVAVSLTLLRCTALLCLR